MWFRRLRRRRSPPLPLLPALDRLAELIDRVVALLDQVSLAPEPAQEELELQEHELDPVADGWVAFVSSPVGYSLLERDGLPPERGTTVELDGLAFVVVRLAASPLPRDRRRCAYVERQERLEPERTFDR